MIRNKTGRKNDQREMHFSCGTMFGTRRELYKVVLFGIGNPRKQNQNILVMHLQEFWQDGG